ncbi:MAG: hypothetical protein EA348_04400 [Pseudomonadaceae bacterium]|nr:MAG: hypothetical protein EA348_04400 [Pseudomonadaceae bacterium]
MGKCLLNHSKLSRCYQVAALLCYLLLSAQWAVARPADQPVTLYLAGNQGSYEYTKSLMIKALEAADYRVVIVNVGEDTPMSRMEVMLLRGDISLIILGQTDQRDRRYLPIPVGMTDGLIGQRILFIPLGQQARYDKVRNLHDLQQLGVVAGLGEAWADVAIWAANDLPTATISGDWKRLYRMLAAGNRQIDYLPRGAQEITREWQLYPELAVEQQLLLRYAQDHILYVSPEKPELHTLLLAVMQQAYAQGMIRDLVRHHYQAVFEPPISLDQRRVIDLQLAD